MGKKKFDYGQILDELEEARLLALRNESPSAAISASLGKAKVLALMNGENKKAGDVFEAYKQVLVEFV